MKTFSVMSNGRGKYKALKVGWSWPAFFFGSLWALFSGLWILGIIAFPIEYGLSLVSQSLQRIGSGYDADTKRTQDFMIALIGGAFLIIRILFGLFGNRFKTQKAERKGFIHISQVKSSDSKTAIECCKGDSIGHRTAREMK